MSYPAKVNTWKCIGWKLVRSKQNEPAVQLEKVALLRLKRVQQKQLEIIASFEPFPNIAPDKRENLKQILP